VNKWLIALTSFSAGGLVSALLVAYLFYLVGTLPPGCYAEVELLPGITADCVKVLKSEYAYLGPLPLDLAAAGWFAINMTSALWLFRALDARIAKFLFYWRILGLSILPYLIYIEFIILKAICIYCTIMHIFIIIDFIIITLFLRKYKWIK